MGRSAGSEPIAAVEPAVVRNVVLPELLARLASKDADVVAAAALSLARIVRPQHAELALSPLLRCLDHEDARVRQVATLALGVLEAKEAVPHLVSLLLDREEGRRSSGRSEGVEPRTRALAAAALGRIGAAESFEPLRAVIRDADLRHDLDLQQTALLALGMLRGCENAAAQVIAAELRDSRANARIRAEAPIALARLAATTAGRGVARALLPELVSVLQGDVPDDLRRSAAIALGQIAALRDAEVIDALVASAEKAKDAATRNLSVIALAQLAELDPDGDASREPAADERIEQWLAAKLEDSRDVSQRPFAALGLALWSREPTRSEAAKARAGERLRAAFSDAGNPSVRGAIAIALGLAGATGAADAVVREFDGTREAKLAGYLAVSVGLLEAHPARRKLSARAEESGHDPFLSLQLARGLALLGDPAIVPQLVERIEKSSSFAQTSSAARALGMLGDASAIPALVRLLDEERHGAQRAAVAAIALGLLAEKSELPWNAGFRADGNYLAHGPALVQVVMTL